MENQLRTNWGIKSTQEIADDLGITYRQAESKAYTLGLTRSAKPTLTTHPLPQMQDWEWAYLAGLIDGEGTISIVTKQVKGKTYWAPVTHVTNTCPKMRDWLVARKFQVSLRCNTAGCWYFTLTIPKIHLQYCLEKLCPYLTTKQHLAISVLRWMELRQTLPFRFTPLPEMQKIQEEIRTWNMTGSEKYGNSLLKQPTISSPMGTTSSQKV